MNSNERADWPPGKKAAWTRKWNKAKDKAALTAKWAVIMTKVRIRRVTARTKWQLVTFTGPHKGESVGIVDMLAIRKDHRSGKNGLKRGDRFQIILIQVKGGSAAMPTLEDVERLRTVARQYRAKALLAQWEPGQRVEFSRLRKTLPKKAKPTGVWKKLKSLREVFR
jgi:hypothetical protein